MKQILINRILEKNLKLKKTSKFLNINKFIIVSLVLQNSKKILENYKNYYANLQNIIVKIYFLGNNMENVIKFVKLEFCFQNKAF